MNKTKENIEKLQAYSLIKKDLLGRCLYGVKIQRYDDKLQKLIIDTLTPHYLSGIIFYGLIDTLHITPCLRSMDKLTESEMLYIHKNITEDITKLYNLESCTKLLDYFDSIHIDYRGLIDKGLALSVNNNFYNII